MRIVPARPRATLRPSAVLTLAGFATSLAVYVLSYAGIVAFEVAPVVWGLHVGAGVALTAFVRALRRGPGERRFQWHELLPYVPLWARVAVSVLITYAGVNFFLATEHLPRRGEGAAGSRTPEQRLYEVRLFSGFWLVTYAVSALFFLYVPPGTRPPAGGEPSTGRRPTP